MILHCRDDLRLIEAIILGGRQRRPRRLISLSALLFRADFAPIRERCCWPQRAAGYGRAQAHSPAHTSPAAAAAASRTPRPFYRSSAAPGLTGPRGERDRLRAARDR